jgi:hypothetical protein
MDKKENENGEVNQKKEESDINIKLNNPTSEKMVATVSPSPRKEKIITPENFKKVKEIHPHEVVRIVSDNKEHDLGEGQEIKF